MEANPFVEHLTSRGYTFNGKLYTKPNSNYEFKVSEINEERIYSIYCYRLRPSALLWSLNHTAEQPFNKDLTTIFLDNPGHFSG